MICSNCGTENRIGAKFCMECARPFAATCPSCGAANLPAAKFCSECATPMSGGAAEVVTKQASTPAPAPIAAASAATAERRLVSIDNPGAPAWSHDGSHIAYITRGSVFVVDAAGGTPSLKVAHVPGTSRAPSWSQSDVRVSAGGAWSPVGSSFVQPGPRPACPGHTVLREGVRVLTGSCLITGTSKADVIEGTRLWGDVIQGLAGNDQIHANDAHTDAVNCGPGRDTVWADRTDKLTGCEIIHR